MPLEQARTIKHLATDRAGQHGLLSRAPPGATAGQKRRGEEERQRGGEEGAWLEVGGGGKEEGGMSCGRGEKEGGGRCGSGSAQASGWVRALPRKEPLEELRQFLKICFYMHFILIHNTGVSTEHRVGIGEGRYRDLTQTLNICIFH